jgi:hypothetical protein
MRHGLPTKVGTKKSITNQRVTTNPVNDVYCQV